MSMQRVPRHGAASSVPGSGSRHSKRGRARENRALIAASTLVFSGALALSLVALPGHHHAQNPGPGDVAAESTPTIPGSGAPSSASTIESPSAVTRDSRRRRVEAGGLPPLTRRSTPSLPPATTRSVSPRLHPPASPGPSTSAPAPSATGLPDPDQLAQTVFDAVNSARRDAGLRPLRWNRQLQTSAHQHNLAMAQVNTLAHQLPGENDLGRRESAAGVAWWWAGENIGENGAMTTQGRSISSQPC